MSKVLMVSGEVVGPRMAGPGIRAWELGRQLARKNEVRLAVPDSTPPLTTENPALIHYEADGRALAEQMPWADLIVAQAWSTLAFPFLADPARVLVFDLYNPSFFENLVDHAGDVSDQEYNLQFGMDLARDLLAIGDFFICANERQRDFWLGWLAALGRLNHLGYRADPSFRILIDVVPFGLPGDPPRHTARVLKGVYPGIAQDDKVVLWNGGMWQWLDPAICVQAIQRLATSHPNIKLFFLSTGEISASPARMMAARRARELADEYGLTGRQVFFNETWVAYDQRQNYLLEADLGLLAHRPHIETRFSNRTRLLDCVWTGLPVVTTRGDLLSEWIERHGLGRCVAHDAGQIAQAILEVLATPRETFRPRFEQLASQLAWPRAVEPLARFCARPAKAPDHRPSLVAQWKDNRAVSTARRESELLDAYRKLDQMHDHIEAIRRGRVMRLLNKINRWLSIPKGHNGTPGKIDGK